MRVSIVETASFGEFRKRIEKYKPPEVIVDQNGTLQFLAGEEDPDSATIYFYHEKKSKEEFLEAELDARLVAGSVRFSKFLEARRTNERTCCLEGSDLAVYQFFGPVFPQDHDSQQLGNAEWARAVSERGLPNRSITLYADSQSPLALANAGRNVFLMTRIPDQYRGKLEGWLGNVAGFLQCERGHEPRFADYGNPSGPCEIYASCLANGALLRGEK